MTDLADARASLDRWILEHATDQERDLLRTERPDLFPAVDGGNKIVIQLGFDAGNGRELIVDLGPEAPAYPADVALRRAQTRARFKLPVQDCGARRPNTECHCLTSALDELGTEADKAAILAAARKRHKRRPARPWRRTAQVSKEPVAEPEATTVERTAASQPPAETPRRRRRREPAHPLSYAAFREQDGPTLRSLLDRDF